MRKAFLSLCIFLFAHSAFAQEGDVNNIGSWITTENKTKEQYTVFMVDDEEDNVLFIICAKRSLQIALLVEALPSSKNGIIDVQVKWGNQRISKAEWLFNDGGAIILLTDIERKAFVKNVLKHDKLAISFRIGKNDMNSTFEFEETKKALQQITKNCPI